MSIDDMIAVLQAAKDGKQIQSRSNGSSHEWQDTYPVWDFCGIDYRVKPVPREWRIPKSVLESYTAVPSCNRALIKVREVLQ
jgi:hypothetical protein